MFSQHINGYNTKGAIQHYDVCYGDEDVYTKASVVITPTFARLSYTHADFDTVWLEEFMCSPEYARWLLLRYAAHITGNRSLCGLVEQFKPQRWQNVA
jgi:hypothetical protein